MAEYNPSKIIKDGNTYNFRDDTKIPLAGSNQISGSLVPSTDGTVNLGSSTAQWNNAYIKSLTINGVACGNILTHNVSEFVDVSSDQTIGGKKTFTDRLTYKSTSTIAGDGTSGNFAGSFNFTDKNDVQIGTFGLSVFNNNGYTEQALNIINPLWFNDGTKTKNFAVRLRVMHATEEVSFTPTGSNIINLGSTAFKWKSFNGINPGALSLPSGTVGMNLIGDVSVVGVEKKLSKDITVTGYIYVDVSFASSNRLNLYNDTKKYGIWLPCDSGRIRQIMPISAGDRLEFNVLDDGSTVNAIQLFACQGNV